MSRIVIILDVDDVEPSLDDPHEVADDLLDLRGTFAAGDPFITIGTERTGVIVSAEWAT